MSTSSLAQPVRVVVVGSGRAVAGAGRYRVAVAALVVLALVALAYVHQASLVATIGYDVQDLQAIRLRRIGTMEQLRFEMARAQALDRIARDADRIGLVPAERYVYVRVSPPAETAPPPKGSAQSPSAARSPDWIERFRNWILRER